MDAPDAGTFPPPSKRRSQRAGGISVRGLAKRRRLSGTLGRDTEGDGSISVGIRATADVGSEDKRKNRGPFCTGLESNREAGSIGHDRILVDFGDMDGDDYDGLHAGDAGGFALGFGATSDDPDEVCVDPSPWALVLGFLDATGPRR